MGVWYTCMWWNFVFIVMKLNWFSLFFCDCELQCLPYTFTQAWLHSAAQRLISSWSVHLVVTPEWSEIMDGYITPDTVVRDGMYKIQSGHDASPTVSRHLCAQCLLFEQYYSLFCLLNFGLATARRRALDRSAWRQLVYLTCSAERERERERERESSVLIDRRCPL